MGPMWDTDILFFTKKGQNALHAAFGIPLPNPLRKKECPLPPKKGIIIYGASYWSIVPKPGKYLDKKKKEYTYVDIDKVKNYQKNIFPLTDNYEYIPVIFINGKFIGGYSELEAKKNPKVRVKKDKYRSYFVNEEGYDLTSIPFDGVELSEDEYMITLGEPMERAESIVPRRGNWHRIGMAAYDGKKSIIEVGPATMFGDTAVEGRFHGIGSQFQTRHSIFFKFLQRCTSIPYGIDSHEKRAFCDSTSTRKLSNERGARNAY